MTKKTLHSCVPASGSLILRSMAFADLPYTIIVLLKLHNSQAVITLQPSRDSVIPENSTNAFKERGNVGPYLCRRQTVKHISPS